MRVSLSSMVMVSLALHGAVAAGVALASWHATPAPLLAALPAAAKPSEVILLRSEETPGLAQPAPIASTRRSAAALASAPIRALPAAHVPRTIPPAPPTLALEANPNAHVRALPPEAVLSPTPAPRLNGQDGVVFVLDVSGSMYEPYAGSTRLAFARQELTRRIQALKDGTPFAITLYAQSPRNSGPLVAAGDATREAAVRFILRDVDCGGGTNLPAGLTSAAGLHAGNLVVVTDGDLNISVVNLETAAQDILGPEGHCPGLTVIGIGPRPNTTAERLLQGLADQEGGAYVAEQFESASRLFTSASESIKSASVTP